MKTSLNLKLLAAALGSALIAAPLTASAGHCGSNKTYHKQAYQSGMSERMQAYPSNLVPMVHRTTSNSNYAYPGGSYGKHGGYANAKSYRMGHHAMYEHAPMAEPAKAVEPAKADKDIVDTAINAGNFTTLVTAVQAAGLVDTLKGDGPFTVFAPTDDAFAKIPQDQLVALLADKDALTRVLTYHVVPGAVSSGEVVKLDSARTVQGSNVTIDVTDGVKIDGANVIVADIVTSNGIIHVIDTVIMPN